MSIALYTEKKSNHYFKCVAKLFPDTKNCEHGDSFVFRCLGYLVLPYRLVSRQYFVAAWIGLSMTKLFWAFSHQPVKDWCELKKISDKISIRHRSAVLNVAEKATMLNLRFCLGLLSIRSTVVQLVVIMPLVLEIVLSLRSDHLICLSTTDSSICGEDTIE